MKSVRILLTIILVEIFLAIFLLRIEKLKMTLQKMIFKTNRKEFTTRGIPRRSPIRVLIWPDWV